MDGELEALTATVVVVQLPTTAARSRSRARSAGELRGAMAQLGSALAEVDPQPRTMVTIQATTFGHSRVNQAGRDLRVTTWE